MAGRRQPHRSNQHQQHAAGGVAVEHAGTGHAAAGQPQRGKHHAGNARRRIGIERPRRKQAHKQRRQPHIRRRQSGSAGHRAVAQKMLDGGKSFRLVRPPQIMRKHARPQPGKHQKQQHPRILAAAGGAAGFGRSVGQHGGFPLQCRRQGGLAFALGNCVFRQPETQRPAPCRRRINQRRHGSAAASVGQKAA